MIIRKSLLGLAAAGMVLGSTAATAAPVASERSASKVRAADGVVDQGTWALLVALIIALGLGAILLGNDSEDAPTSP